MKKYYIYKITNKITLQYYIGMHISDEFEKFDKYYGSGVIISRMIKKYGKSNFNKQILQSASSEEQLIQLQKKYVNEQVVNDPMSYNLNTGGSSWYFVNKLNLGRGALKRKLQSDQQFKKYYSEMISTRMKQYHKTNNNAFKGRKHTSESKLLIKLNHYDCNGENNSQYGTHWYCNRAFNKNLKLRDGDVIPEGYELGMIRPPVSQQTRQRISQANKGKTMSEQTRQKLIGRKCWCAGQKLSYPSKSKGRICINKDNKNKFIYPQELPKYESQGWQKGMCNNHNWKNPDMVRTKIKESLKG